MPRALEEMCDRPVGWFSRSWLSFEVNAAGRGGPPSSNGTLQKLWQNAQDFETVFLENMFEHLTSGLSGDGPLGAGGAGGDYVRFWRPCSGRSWEQPLSCC